MFFPPKLLSRVALSVQPLIFETYIPDFPYSTIGTVFLVGFGGRPFVLTTRHGLSPDTTGAICVVPSDSSQRLIPLKDVFFVPKTVVPDDCMDFAVISVDTLKVKNAEVGEAVLIDLALACGDWSNEDMQTDYYIIGFPKDHSFIDNDIEMIHSERITLKAKYIGQSVEPYLHEIEVTEPHTLSSFDGFSGSPVFGVTHQLNEPPSVVICGMAIRGTSTSNRIHFLDRSILLDALEIYANLR